MDKTVHTNRPDIDPTLVDKTNKEAAFSDTAVLLIHNLQATITEKHHKYYIYFSLSGWLSGYVSSLFTK
jgi:hypothetical protein